MEPLASAGLPLTWHRKAGEEEVCVGGKRQRYEMIWRGGGGSSEGHAGVEEVVVGLRG